MISPKAIVYAPPKKQEKPKEPKKQLKPKCTMELLDEAIKEEVLSNLSSMSSHVSALTSNLSEDSFKKEMAKPDADIERR